MLIHIIIDINVHTHNDQLLEDQYITYWYNLSSRPALAEQIKK